jgi:hypothetical protein
MFKLIYFRRNKIHNLFTIAELKVILIRMHLQHWAHGGSDNDYVYINQILHIFDPQGSWHHEPETWEIVQDTSS